MTKIKINENIALLRKEKGITQEELALKLGVSNQAISKWEAGKCCPDIGLLPDLARIFEVSIDALLLGECLTKTKTNSRTNGTIILQALKICEENQYISTSILQRKLNIGYGHAKKIIDDMYQCGYILNDTSKHMWKYLYNQNAKAEIAFNESE